MLPTTMRRARVATMIVLAAAACGKDGSGGGARSPTPGADTGAAPLTLDAADLGLIKPILVGPLARIRAAADQAGRSLDGIELVDAELRKARAIADHHIAVARLEFLTGTLLARYDVTVRAPRR
mgnify:CR=1 FL=1